MEVPRTHQIVSHIRLVSEGPRASDDMILTEAKLLRGHVGTSC
jgi:hypothetical protein